MTASLIIFLADLLVHGQNHQMAAPMASLPVSQPLWLDLHYHWENHSNLDEMIRQNQMQGVKLGVTAEGGEGWGVNDNEKLNRFVKTLQGKPVYKGLQVYGLGWEKRYSPQALAQLDYIAADALLLPDKDGHSVALWQPGVRFPDAQEFMERYVAYNVKVLSGPINIWSNPTYLPISLQPQYEQLWTKERMLILIKAAQKNLVAVEINSKYNIPHVEFLRLTKQAGCRFSLGSNRHDAEAGDLDYSIRMYKECGLTPRDMYIPNGVRVK